MPDVELGFWGRIGGRIKNWRVAQLRFIDDWRTVLKRAWTMRISFVLVFLGVFFLLMPMMSDELKHLVGPWTFALMFLIVGFTVGVARLLKQPGAEEPN